MISIIVSSYNLNFFNQFSKNVAETIGVPYEIIKIDNPGLMGICEAYNRGAEQAKFELLCFVHEDVEFGTIGWGTLLHEKYFNLPDVGILGFAGASTRYDLPYGYSCGLKESEFVFVNHPRHLGIPVSKKAGLVPAKVIDGVFLAMKKDVWEKLSFNESIKGFHFYDIDISLRASKFYRNYLINDINLSHFSRGNFGNEWMEECLRFNQRDNYPFDRLKKEKLPEVRDFLYIRFSGENISLRNRLRYVRQLGFDRKTIKRALWFLRRKS